MALKVENDIVIVCKSNVPEVAVGQSPLRDESEGQYTLLSFSCFHFAVVSDTPWFTNKFDEACDWTLAHVELNTKPITDHSHICVCCSKPGCQEISMEERVRRASTAIASLRNVLEVQFQSYRELGQNYHSVSWPVRAALSDIEECELSHKQFGGIQMLPCVADPIFVPYTQAVMHLKTAEKLIQGEFITADSCAQVLDLINLARKNTSQFGGSLMELLQGVMVLAEYGRQYGDDPTVQSYEGKLISKAIAGSIRHGWMTRTPMEMSL